MEANKRIEFIDLAKGICIILVTTAHCGFPIEIPGFDVVRMPLYFVISGLFFKPYSGFREFIIRKTNKILIPFVFFYLTGYAIYYVLMWLMPSVVVTNAGGIMDIVDNRNYFNGPIWFLLSLYWCGLMFAVLKGLIKSDIWRCVVVLLLGATGVALGCAKVTLPMFIDSAFTALPFFCLGYYLKNTKLLYQNKFDKYNVLFAIFFYLVSYIVATNTHVRLSLHYNIVENILCSYTLAVLSVLTILLFCKVIVRLPIVSYLGRYSLIVLCTHHLVYRPLKVIFAKTPFELLHQSWFLTLATLAICCLLIPICIKCIPHFVAQKDLIKWGTESR